MNPLSCDDAGKLVLRLTVGILMLFHGAHKVMNPGNLDFIGSKLDAVGLPTLLAQGVYVGEIVAPVLLIVGLLTRLGALVIVINMIFAVWLVHMDHLMLLTEHGGWRLELQAFYLFGALAVMFLGPGKFALMPDKEPEAIES